MNTTLRHLLTGAAALALLGAVGCNESGPNATEKTVYGNGLYNQDDLPYLKNAPKPVTTVTPAPAQGAQAMSPEERGHQLYTQLACVTCHTLDGSRGLAPTFKGVYGRNETLADGNKITVDDAYIKESLLNPTAKLVQGFAPVMPSFDGRVSPEDVQAIIAFLKTVK
jgi:cytochrome c2